MKKEMGKVKKAKDQEVNGQGGKGAPGAHSGLNIYQSHTGTYSKHNKSIAKKILLPLTCELCTKVAIKKHVTAM